VQFVLKEMKPRSRAIFDYELELRNLSILRLLKHPHIIELLACFTHSDGQSFIFSLANGGSLADVFNGKRSSPFQRPEDLLVALCGLSSAIRTVHTFHADDFEAIGCHHDLKPSNVLLDGSKLLLADFGLSRFKNEETDSASYFRGGRGDYIAPECQDLGDDFKKHLVHRSSDIWSFGCILSELLTLLLKGVEGVRAFRSSRMFEVENNRYFRFHRGPNTAHSPVWNWLSQLGQDDSKHIQKLKHVISISLTVKPEDRSNIDIIDKWLRFIAVDFLADNINMLYESNFETSKSIPAFLELERFRSWKWSIEQLVTGSQSNEDSFLSTESYREFEVVLLVLTELCQILQAILPESHQPQKRLFLPLRKLNDTLYGCLPPTSRSLAKIYFESHLLESHDDARLHDLSELTNADTTQPSRIGQLAAVKRLHALVERSEERVDAAFKIDRNSINRTAWLQDFYIGELVKEDKQHVSNNVIVETKNYDEHYSIESIAKELFARLKATVRLLNTAQSFRVLRCNGYYHDMKSFSLGLVYSYPTVLSLNQQQSQQALETSTLHSILQQDFKGQYRPLLGDRFRLAHSLAHSVFEFHKVNWVHRSLSAFNIVFFKPPAALWTDHMREPYFMGFLTSRRNDTFSFTEGPTDDEQHKKYLSPEYGKDSQRFLQHYDYYSLGIILLELGLWRTLEDMSKGVAFQGSREELKEALLRLALPRLGQTMGVVYQQAVQDCLCWKLQQEEQANEDCSSTANLRFYKSVVERLAFCKA
jgi:serine/threonine protein kinase